MHKILVIRLYFPLDALHVSGLIGPSSGRKMNGTNRFMQFVIPHDNEPVRPAICRI